MEPNPLSIILVKSDSKGDRLLFRYPYAADPRTESSQQNRRRNPYALTVTEDLLQSPPPQTSNISKGRLIGFSDEVLSTLFAVKPDLCGCKFELKVNDVRFVGHPTLLQSGAGSKNAMGSHGSTKDIPSIILINIVFALQATASHSIVKCYYDLSKRLGVALRHEEKRCGFLSQETKIMVAAHDEVASRPEGENPDDPVTPFDLILKRSHLANDLRSVYEDLSSTGLVHVRVNKWIEVSFCLPQKVHKFHKNNFIMEPESIHRCLQSLRPYHGILLLVEPSELLDNLPPDASPALVRLVRMYSPLKSLQTLSADADLTLSQVFQLTGHLLYWAKATIIYPLCESNVYVIAPDAPIHVNSPLGERFSEKFPGMNLIQVIGDFSLPTSLSQSSSPLNHPHQQTQAVQMIVWMLQHRLLMQLHTYVYFMPTEHGPPQLPAESEGGWAAAQEADCFYAEPEPDGETELDVYALMRRVSSPEPGADRVEDTFPFGGVRQGGASVDSAVNFTQQEKLDAWEQLVSVLTQEERTAILKIPAAASSDDLGLLAKLCWRGYFQGSHHLEEIMYLENVRRSQLLQLLDKFRDVLTTCETEDPAIAMFYSHS